MNLAIPLKQIRYQRKFLRSFPFFVTIPPYQHKKNQINLNSG